MALPVRACSNFNPRPPYGGRRTRVVSALTLSPFQSTPSIRRATLRKGAVLVPGRISIHALHTEGDSKNSETSLLFLTYLTENGS